MKDLVDLFHEAYSGEQRRRQQFGMDSGDEFDPRNNPYNDGRDPDDIEWDDDGPGDDDDPEGDREETRDKQRRLDAALRQARADEMEDEDDAESEDGESDYSRAGMADS